MCALYTLSVLRKVHKAFAIDEIKKFFEFNSLKDSLEEKKKLELQCEEALEYFDEIFEKKLKSENFHHREPKVLASVNSAYYSCQASEASDRIYQQTSLDRLELEINQIAFGAIALLIEWGRLLSDAKFLLLLDKKIDAQSVCKKITHNPLLSRLSASEKYHQALEKYSVDWSKEKLQAEDSLISALPFLEKNLDASDAEFLTKVVKKNIFNESGALDLFMKKSLAWSQINFLIQNILKNFFGAAISAAPTADEPLGGQGALFSISPEGKDFFRRLMKETMDNEGEIEKLLGKNLENWDLGRVVPLDRIIAQLGICEMKFFPEIPRAVSINEYIEIAKEYGSEQSGKFINGVLNAVP